MDHKHSCILLHLVCRVDEYLLVACTVLVVCTAVQLTTRPVARMPNAKLIPGCVRVVVVM